MHSDPIPLRERLKQRVLSALGLDFDFAVDLGRKRLSEISSSLCVGSRPQAADVEMLMEAGVTHVVTCLPDDQRQSMAFVGEAFQTLFVPVHDGIHEDIRGHFSDVFTFADQARSQSRDAKLLVHCEVGVSRSATIAIALLMKREQLEFLEAFRHVRARRPEVLPNIGFASQLQHLEHDLLRTRRSTPELSSLARYLREVCNVPVEVEVIEQALERYDYDAPQAIRAIFGDDIPRVVQGVRL